MWSTIPGHFPLLYLSPHLYVLEKVQVSGRALSHHPSYCTAHSTVHSAISSLGVTVFHWASWAFLRAKGRMH